MTAIQPRITRKELQKLLRNHAWHRLEQRIHDASADNLKAQMPGLKPAQRSELMRLLARLSKRHTSSCNFIAGELCDHNQGQVIKENHHV
ncbi:MAG: hypothetical protein EA370_11985 [Wenzhouxiangella sp.]|nr:MAG: hypothetical protein EA370_11985 [Wenzhouxiangella sp.]